MGGCNYYCSRRINCKTISLIAAFILGVAAAIIGFFIPVLVFGISAVAFVAGGLGLFALLYAALSENGNKRGCLCSYVRQLLTGILGTILFAALTIILSPIIGIIATVVLFGITIFFLTLLIGTFSCYILCLARDRRCADEE